MPQVELKSEQSLERFRGLIRKRDQDFDHLGEGAGMYLAMREGEAVARASSETFRRVLLGEEKTN